MRYVTKLKKCVVKLRKYVAKSGGVRGDVTTLQGAVQRLNLLATGLYVAGTAAITYVVNLLHTVISKL